jgi:hypothetical protein
MVRHYASCISIFYLHNNYYLFVVPSTYMNAVECSYPMPEDVSIGLLNAAANTFSIPLTFLGQVILESPVNAVGSQIIFPYAVWTIGLLSVSLVNIWFYKGSHLRLGQDSMKLKQSTEVHSVFHLPVAATP